MLLPRSFASELGSWGGAGEIANYSSIRFFTRLQQFLGGGQTPGKLILAETWTGRINPLLKLTESQQLMFSTASFLADVSINVCCGSRHLFFQVYDLTIPSYIAFKTLHISICSVDWVHTTHKTNWIEFNYHHSQSQIVQLKFHQATYNHLGG